MSNRFFNILRTMGWMVPMMAVFYAVVADACNLPGAAAVEKVAAGFAVLVNGIVEKCRADYENREPETVFITGFRIPDEDEDEESGEEEGGDE